MVQDFDLHIHTTNSDGEYNIKEIIKKIKSKKIEVFSITDHDSIKSIKQIKELDLEGLTYIPGIEISSVLNSKYELHILGYNIDPDNEELIKVLEYLKEFRINKFHEILKVLKRRFNMVFNEEDITSLLKRVKNPGKPHVARLMIKYGYCNNVKEAFDNYLSKLKLKVHNEMELKIVTKTIKKAGGTPVLAHPKIVENSYHIDINELMTEIKKAGIVGIEVFNSVHSYNDCKKYKQIAEDYNLLISGGSDYHGPNIKKDVKLGVVLNSKKDIKVYKESITILKKLKLDNKVDIK